ncbi:MAG: DUF3108 domain-containing protein [Betaproteobacteria bacterium]
MPTVPPPRSLRVRTGLRAALVLAAVLLLHVALLAEVERGMEFDLPPPQTVVQAELFVLPAPSALADKPTAPPARPTRAITPAAPEAAEPAAAEPAPAPAPEAPPAAAAPAEAPASDAPPPAASAAPPSADGPEGPTARLEALGAVAVDFPRFGRIVSDTVAKRGLLSIDGSTTIEWRVTDDRYRSTAEVADRGGTVFLRQTSEGEVRPASGIAPVRYTEKTLTRAEVAANFQWDAGKVTFSSTAAEFPLVEGIQDRLSFLAQLALLAEAFPSAFAPGAAIAMKVAGPRDVRVYDLRVLGWETLKTPGGSFEALKLDRVIPPGEREVRVQLWLAPALRWLPVRSLTVLPNGDTIFTEYRESQFDTSPAPVRPKDAAPRD